MHLRHLREPYTVCVSLAALQHVKDEAQAVRQQPQPVGCNQLLQVTPGPAVAELHCTMQLAGPTNAAASMHTGSPQASKQVARQKLDE